MAAEFVALIHPPAITPIRMTARIIVCATAHSTHSVHITSFS